MDFKAFYKQHERWLLPTAIALIVFIAAQVILTSILFLQDDPLPDTAAWNSANVQAMAMSSGDIALNDRLEAEVVIQRIGISVPIVWSTSTKESDLEKDLEHGAVHYPGTPVPGNLGNAFVTAHSSDYLWKPGNYKHAFTKLGTLALGDDDIMVIYKKDGVPVYQAKFKVTQKEVVADTDMRMIEQRDKTEMTLVTCWPIGTNWRRLMVKTELVSLTAI